MKRNGSNLRSEEAAPVFVFVVVLSCLVEKRDVCMRVITDTLNEVGMRCQTEVDKFLKLWIHQRGAIQVCGIIYITLRLVTSHQLQLRF